MLSRNMFTIMYLHVVYNKCCVSKCFHHCCIVLNLQCKLHLLISSLLLHCFQRSMFAVSQVMFTIVFSSYVFCYVVLNQQCLLCWILCLSVLCRLLLVVIYLPWLEWAVLCTVGTVYLCPVVFTCCICIITCFPVFFVVGYLLKLIGDSIVYYGVYILTSCYIYLLYKVFSNF